MSFPELLRQCRKQKHMSQAELASLLGVTQQAVGKWESGKSSPDPTTVAKLAADNGIKNPNLIHVGQVITINK